MCSFGIDRAIFSLLSEKKEVLLRCPSHRELIKFGFVSVYIYTGAIHFLFISQLVELTVVSHESLSDDADASSFLTHDGLCTRANACRYIIVTLGFFFALIGIEAIQRHDSHCIILYTVQVQQLQGAADLSAAARLLGIVLVDWSIPGNSCV